MAEFNAWANAELHAACGALSPQALSENRDAFFRSILGTLNHILLVDLLYRERLEGRFPSRFRTLDETVETDLPALSAAQQEIDAFFVDYTSRLDSAALEQTMGFYTLLDDPEYWEVSRGTYFSNLFQHQVHHRGQAHNMLSQAGIDPPPIGFIEFEMERGERVVRRAG
jgi:uncharacterized damage-inducible protein DinB